MIRITGIARVLGVLLALTLTARAQSPGAPVSIVGLELGAKAADRAVARALREPGRGPSDAARAARLFELATELESQGRDDLALLVHRAIATDHPTALMPSGIEGTTFAEESRVRVRWLSGDRSWLASDYRTLYRGLASAIADRDAERIAALAPPDVRVGPFRACPDGWRSRTYVARELAQSGGVAGPLEQDGADTAWFHLRSPRGDPRIVVLGLSRGRAEWQAYCYEEAALEP